MYTCLVYSRLFAYSVISLFRDAKDSKIVRQMGKPSDPSTYYHFELN